RAFTGRGGSTSCWCTLSAFVIEAFEAPPKWVDLDRTTGVRSLRLTRQSQESSRAQNLPGLAQGERMQQILQMLETRDSVHVAELAETFSVSEVTVRSDLTELARQGLVARVRGGVRPLQRGQSELGFDFRLGLEVG